jgi:beta-glucosidase
MPDLDFLYAEGCGRSDERYVVVPAKNLFRKTSNGIFPGVNAHYHPTASLQTNLVLEKTDSEINFQWTLFSVDPMIPYDHFAVEWEGMIVPDVSGKAMIGIEGNDGYKLFLNGKLFIDRSTGQSFETTVLPFSFKKGEAVDLRIEYIERSGNARFKLIWNLGYDYSADRKIEEAIKRARSSDLVVLVAGIEEGEFRDRSDLRLPGRQEELILRLAETGKPIVVILSGGSAITMDAWQNEVDAILDIWYPGERGGDALADILSGKENPSGRLPITFPRSVGQVPLVYNHFPTGRGDDYLDGTGHALFPFGYGLSYTQFEYGHLKQSSNQFRGDEKVRISFWVKNTGSYAGEEVVQLYVKDEIASIARPVKELKAFTRVRLNLGEEKEVSFEVSADDFLFPDENMIDIIEPGSFRIMIGASSKDIRLRTFVEYVK